MLNRLIVALIGIPILFWILLKGGLLLLLFINVVIAVSLFEFFKMSKMSGRKPEEILGYIAGLSIPNMLYFSSIQNQDKAFVFPLVGLLIISIVKRVFQNKIENTTRDIGTTLLGVIYISVLFSHIILINYLPKGGQWILSLQVLVWICDSSAYFVGLNFGRKVFKEGLTPISPKKSKEGFLGAVFFSMLGMYGLNIYFDLFSKSTDVTLILIFGALISLIAQIGDLGESMLKREFGVKDSGKILGDHGGMLDRFDSMLFVIPTAYYLLKIM